MLKSNMPSIHETRPLFPKSSLVAGLDKRGNTFYEENKHSFDDGMSRNIDRDSGFNLEQYKKNMRIYKIIGLVVVVVAVIIVLVCIL